MGSRQDKQPASLPQLLKEQDEIMLLWNVFWRGFEIQPISFYLKQCALTVETFQLAIDPVTAHGAVTGGKSYDRSRCLSVPSERKAESKRRSLSIKDQAQEEAVVGHVPSLKSEASRLYRRGRGEGGLTSGKRDSPSYRSLAQKPKLSDDRGYRPIHSYSRTPPREPKERRKHRKSHVGLDLVETGEPAETVVRLPEVVEQKIPAYLELIGEEPLVATLARLLEQLGRTPASFFFQSLEKGAWSAMFPTYPLVIPMIPRCTYSPQPSVQIYLGYGHCTPIVVSPISASVGGTYDSSEMAGGKRGKVAANEWWVRGECYGFELHFPLAEMTGRSRPIENRGMTMYSFPYGAHGVAYFERGRRGEDCRVTKELRRNAERIADMPLDMAGWSGLCPSEFYPRYHKEHCPATARGYLRSPTEQNGENSRERRDKKGKVLLRLKMRLSLRDPLVIGPPLLAKKERQSSRSDLARGRIEMPIDEVGEASLPAKGDCLLFDENEKGN
ncbi:hypothetical protein L1987_88466 [Smallanthus sonchifolius]|nr:hypothetical protein L1987_88466 [Smallanthus sonchifolius]